jgi:APA family basic amino acid/polyamine antiporter
VNQAFMALTVLGLFILRRTMPSLPRPFRVPLYPVTPLAYLLILVWYLGTLLLTRLPEVVIGIAIVAAGLPFYFHWRRAHPADPAAASPQALP